MEVQYYLNYIFNKISICSSVILIGKLKSFNLI